jgi:MFS transporter, MHS family, proline/betaine transporter
MRPIGGIITGHIGDVHGRKRALVFSLFSMVVPTVAMGFLPTYKQVGGWSTALLVICRLLQGFSVGGQLPSSLVYTLETKPKKHWVSIPIISCVWCVARL